MVQLHRLTARKVPSPSQRKVDTVRSSPKGMMKQEMKRGHKITLFRVTSMSSLNKKQKKGTRLRHFKEIKLPCHKVNPLPPFLHAVHNNHLHRQYQCCWCSSVCFAPFWPVTAPRLVGQDAIKWISNTFHYF